METTVTLTELERTDISIALGDYLAVWADRERECRSRKDNEGEEKARQYYRELSELRRKINNRK
jgi:hypothetical protein